MTVVALREKLEKLCRLANIGLDDFPADMIKVLLKHNKTIARRTLDSWIVPGATPDIRDHTKDLLIEYWGYKKIEVNLLDLSEPFDEFVKRIDSRMKAVKDVGGFDIHKKIKDLTGKYQIIRPHTATEGRYVLELMELDTSTNQALNLFYSHNHPDISYLYTGKAGIAERYYFSLMTRTNERDSGQNSFRCVSFYIGDGLWPACLSGIMLRGVTGDATPKQSVAIPFIAMRTRDHHALKAPDFTKVVAADSRAPSLHKLAPGSNLVAGQVSERFYPDVHHYCSDIFKQIEAIPNGLFVGSRPILHTIPGVNLQDIDAINIDHWTKIVDALPEETAEAVAGG